MQPKPSKPVFQAETSTIVMRLFPFLLLLCLALPLSAQEAQPFAIEHTIASEAFGDDRTITVYLPPNYYNRPGEKYMITYVLDGHYTPFIDLVVKTIEYNTNTRNYIPTIVVGIHAKQRGWEFSAPTPGDEDDAEYEGGRAPELQKHLDEEVIPFVEKLFPEALDYRALIGHSAGGAFVLYTLFSDKPDIFDGYIAISPGLRPGENRILEEAATRLRQGATYRKFLYTSAGTVSEREDIFGGAVRRLDALLGTYPNHGLLWYPKIFEGEDHFTVVPMTVNAGMLAMARDFRVDEAVFTQLADRNEPDIIGWVNNFYKQRKADYGFQVFPSANSLSRIARFMAKKGKTAAALDIFNWGLQKYPDDYWLTYNSGSVHLQRGEIDATRTVWQKCQQILEKTRADIGEERYENRTRRLKEEMEKLKE